MSVEENKAVARRFVEEGWCQEGLDILGEMAAEDLIWREHGYKSLAEYHKHMSWALAGLPDLHFVADKVVAEEDEVVAVWTGSGTHTGEWGGLLPTNKKVTWTGATVFRIADGKLACFAIAGANRKWHWAEARIDDSSVVVWSDEVPSPVAVRYAYSMNPEGATLYNKEGLPASPFCTDDW